MSRGGGPRGGGFSRGGLARGGPRGGGGGPSGFHVPTGAGQALEGSEDIDNKKIRCEVCDCEMTGDASYQQHMAGARHMKNVKNRADGVPLVPSARTKKAEPPTLELRCKPLMEKCTKPLIGINYMTEVQKSLPGEHDHYACFICNSRSDVNAVISHLSGRQHRLNVIKEHYPEMLAKINDVEGKKSEQTQIIEDCAQEIEEKAGRREMKVTSDKDNIMSSHMTMNRLSMVSKTTEFSRGRGRGGRGGFGSDSHGGRGGSLLGKRPFNNGRDEYGPPKMSRGRGTGFIGGQGWQGGRGRFGDYDQGGLDMYEEPPVKLSFLDLMRRIIKFLDYDTICNEEEARLALQVSNQLSENLMKYRMRSMPDLNLKKFGGASSDSKPAGGFPPSSENDVPDGSRPSFGGSSSYGGSSSGYGPSSSGYGPSSSGYGPLSSGYGPLSSGYGSKGYGSYSPRRGSYYPPQY